MILFCPHIAGTPGFNSEPEGTKTPVLNLCKLGTRIAGGSWYINNMDKEEQANVVFIIDALVCVNGLATISNMF